jgi:hypothetical protein
MYTFWFIETEEEDEPTPRVEVTHQGKTVPLSEVPTKDLRDVLENIHGLTTNGRWTTSL